MLCFIFKILRPLGGRKMPWHEGAVWINSFQFIYHFMFVGSHVENGWTRFIWRSWKMKSLHFENVRGNFFVIFVSVNKFICLRLWMWSETIRRYRRNNQFDPIIITRLTHTWILNILLKTEWHNRHQIISFPLFGVQQKYAIYNPLFRVCRPFI